MMVKAIRREYSRWEICKHGQSKMETQARKIFPHGKLMSREAAFSYKLIPFKRPPRAAAFFLFRFRLNYNEKRGKIWSAFYKIVTL